MNMIFGSIGKAFSGAVKGLFGGERRSSSGGDGGGGFFNSRQVVLVIFLVVVVNQHLLLLVSRGSNEMVWILVVHKSIRDGPDLLRSE